MPYAKVNDINMYYEIHGEGKPLVLNSGGGGRVESQELRIAALSPEYQVITYEVRGAGRTDASDIPYTMELFADDLAGLLDTLDIDLVHIFGESFGSAVAQVFTMQYPEKVKSLILASSSPGRSHVKFSQEAMPFMSKLYEMTPEERSEMQVNLFMTREFIENNPDYVEKRKKSMMIAAADASRGSTGSQQAVFAFDGYNRLPEIKVPTLVIHGEADSVLPPDNSRIIASRIPNAELVTFPNTSHLLLEAGDELYRVMMDFLKRHSQK